MINIHTIENCVTVIELRLCAAGQCALGRTVNALNALFHLNRSICMTAFYFHADLLRQNAVMMTDRKYVT